MGGSAAMIIIHSDNTISKGWAYNASMSEVSINHEFIHEKDVEVRDTFLRLWAAENLSQGRPVYFAPENYGLIIIDNKNKRFLSHQNYTSLCEVNHSLLILIQDDCIAGIDSNYEWRQIEGFLKDRNLHRTFYEVIDGQGMKVIEKIPDEISTMGALMKYLNKRQRKGYLNLTGLTFECDWENIDFRNLKNEMVDFYEYCKEHYSELMTKDDHQQWIDWFECHEIEYK
jgi:hypothetical protein